MNYLIINDKGDFFERYSTSIDEVLTEYAVELVSKNILSVDLAFWMRLINIMAGIRDLDKIELLNYLCKRDRYKIKKILSNCTNVFPPMQ